MNTGNIARTCAATGSRLHLVRPLGFDISDKAVKRAGLDYWSLVDLHVYDGLDDFFRQHPRPDLWLTTTRADRCYADAAYADGCWLFFGKETAGLPGSCWSGIPSAASGSPCGRTPAASTWPTRWRS